MILTKQFLNQTIKQTLKEKKRDLDPEKYDVFLSYGFHDLDYAYKVVALLENCGYTVYFDYEDPKLDRRYVNKSTAKRLLKQMKKCRALLYLYSPSSSVSKWCPWEVGVFSGIKNFRCANLPIVERKTDNYKNQEYLDLYPYVDYDTIQDTNTYDFWICNSDTNYVSLKEWLSGTQPFDH